SIVTATRESRRVRVGVSPRGTNSLQRAAQAHAFLDGRDYVIPDDIKTLARSVLAHRIVLEGALPGDGSFKDHERVLQEIVDHVEVPL
ncbi:MAG: AAA family ATPase, partial [Planctomycetota bacterium]